LIKTPFLVADVMADTMETGVDMASAQGMKQPVKPKLYRTKTLKTIQIIREGWWSPLLPVKLP
jgi:hypothetical protein